ncbi:MAG: MFS transporter [Propionibacteriaceae bacterium]|jgi:MFS family permease|nr:MFS transporter [Propionibacteriaceae bacterium]
MRGVENSINPLNRLREWPLLVSQFLGSAAAGAALSIGILLAEQVTESESWATVIRASGWLAAAVFARPLNELAVRRSRRFAMLTGWILATAGTALISFAASLNSTPLTVAGMTATGAGAAAMLQARFAIAEMVLPQQRAAAIVRLTWAGALGSIAGPSLGFLSPLGRLLAGANEHSSSYAVAAVLMVVGTLTLLALRPPPDQPDSNRQNTSAASRLWRTLAF